MAANVNGRGALKMSHEEALRLFSLRAAGAPIRRLALAWGVTEGAMESLLAGSTYPQVRKQVIDAMKDDPNIDLYKASHTFYPTATGPRRPNIT